MQGLHEKKAGEVKLSIAEMSEVLSYVKENERRVISSSVVNRSIYSEVMCLSPSYTIKPVKYLSTSELAISTAQVTHILFDYIVRLYNFPYKEKLTHMRLKKLRESHDVYFVDWSVNYKKKYIEKKYYLSIDMNCLLCKGNFLIADFKFKVDDYFAGEFKAVISLSSK